MQARNFQNYGSETVALMDYFAGAVVRRMAREEAMIAVRSRGSGAVSYLLDRAHCSPDLQRRQVYRIAATLVPKILAEDDQGEER